MRFNKHNLPAYQYNDIIRLYHEGFADWKIADKCDLEEKVVCDVINEYEGIDD